MKILLMLLPLLFVGCANALWALYSLSGRVGEH
jgi:hypothetical protein